MKTGNALMITGIVVVSLCLASTSTWAGSKQQHRWEGVAIGVGAAIVGSALINHHTYGYHGGPPVALSFNYRDGHRHAPGHYGKWKRHHGPHNNHWRSPGQHYRGYPRYGNHHGYGGSKNWNSHGPGTPGRQGRQHGDHGGRRK